MQVGTNVWLKDNHLDLFRNDQWVASTIKSMKVGANGETTVVVNKDLKAKADTILTIPAGQFELDELKFRNSTQHQGAVSNLNNLCFLNEPELLAALRHRYQKNILSAYVGQVLLHINPMKAATAAEERDSDADAVLQQFAQDIKKNHGLTPEAWQRAKTFMESRNGGLGRSTSNENLGAPAGSSTTGLLAQLQDQHDEEHEGGDASTAGPLLGHSIILNGETGSGKSETAKALLGHLLGGAEGVRGELREKIKHATVLLEALGNARLLRNLNSSRFGKYLELGFNASHHLVGAHVRCFLLESVLVCKQSAEESNFHIFYQLVRGSKATERVKWGLSGDITAYNYLYQTRSSYTDSQSDLVAAAAAQAAEGAAAQAALELMNSPACQEADVAGFQALKDSLEFLGLSADTVQQFFSVIAGILHLGQVQFDTKSDLSGDSGVIVDAAPLAQAARLLGVEQGDLEGALVKKKSLVIRGEVFAKSLTAAQGYMTRDATARYLYKRTFEWALRQVNACLHPSAGADAGKLASCVGILDIFGFEQLQGNHNSFEQLCINYAAEVLHKHFCESVFALELVEYAAEGIKYDEAAYKRRHPLLKLIGTELVGMLDEQCRLPNPTDSKLLTKMYKKFGVQPTTAGPAILTGNQKYLRIEENDYSDRTFRVRHYCTEVVYNVSGFLEKHYDEVPEAVEKLLQTSTSVVLNAFAAATAVNATKAEGAGSAAAAAAAPTSAASSYLANLKNRTAGGQNTVSPTNAVKRAQNVNLGTLVRQQLTQLMEEIEMTVPHFVRCIKAADKPAGGYSTAQRRESEAGTAAMSNNPLMKKTRRSTAGNNTATAAAAAAAVGNATFNPYKVLQQLRNCGLVDAVTASRTYYRVKMPLRDFYLRYRGIVGAEDSAYSTLPRFLPEASDIAEAAKSCSLLLQALPTAAVMVAALKTTKGAPQWQQGKTSVYLTVADHSLLEGVRFTVFEQAGAVLADRLRVFIVRLRFLRMLKSLQTIQRAVRGRKGREEAAKRRRFLRAVVSIQRRFRNKAYINDALLKLRRLVKALLTVQRTVRRYCARRMVQRLKAARERYLATSGNLITAKELRLARRNGEVADVSLPIPPVSEKMKDYRAAEAKLLREIQAMIHGTKVTNHDALVKFDVKETKKVLMDWAEGSSSPELKANLQKLAGRVDVCYKLLRPEELIPLTNQGCLAAFQSIPQRRRKAAKHADKRVHKDHLVFRGISKVQVIIEELLRVTFLERKEALNRIEVIKKDLMRNIRKFGPEFSRTRAAPFYAEIQRIKDFVIIADNIMRFGLVLYKYYQNYVTVIVAEYGENSKYRRDFQDDEVYLLTLQQMMESASSPLHYSEQFLQMANPDPGMDVCADFPLKLVDSRTFADDGSNTGSTRGRIHCHNGVYYRIQPHAPGTDFAVNSFLQFMSPHSIAPSRLLRMAGKSSDNYGQCTYYQASQGMSEFTLVDVFTNPVLIEKLNFTSLSAAILTSLITGAGDCKPENFMVKYVKEQQSRYGSAGEVEKVEILGVSADSVFQRTAFLYDRIEGAYSKLPAPNAQDLLAQREQGVKELGLGFNVLFFLPQMDEPVDPEICRFFRSTPTIPEEMVCTWLKYLHQQNKRYESLRLSGGFTQEDFNALKLPIKIPLGSAIRLLQRLQELREHLTAIDSDKLTHHALLSFWYPELGEYYKDWRFSSNKAHISDADMALVPTETEEDVSLLPLDNDDPTDKSIKAEIMRSKGLSGNAKRAFFFALTPYHKLYHNAVAALEAEVASILEARSRANNAAARANGTAGGEEGLDVIPEVDGDDDSDDGLAFPHLDHPDSGAEGESPTSRPTSSSRRPPRSYSPKAGASSPRAAGFSMDEGLRTPSNIGGFDFIYGDEPGDDDGEEFYEYEEPPAGLLPKGGKLAKVNRYDQKNQSFYKHKAGQTAPPAVTSGAAGFTSPMVTMDVYPRPGLKSQASGTSAGEASSRQTSIRFDNLYTPEDFDYEEAVQNLSEAEQSVLYLRPTAGGAKIPGVPLIAGARSRAPVQRNPMLAAGASQNSPMVTKGDNPMMAKRKAPAPVITEEEEEEKVENEEVQQQQDAGEAGGIAEGDDWRVEEEQPGADRESADGSEQEEADVMASITAATPSSIADVALQFLMSLDFRRFDPVVSRSICRIIGDSLSFLDTLWLRYINEDQLRYMFEGYFEQKRNHRVATALTTTAGPADVDEAANSSEIYATKELKLIGMTPDVFKKLQKTNTVNRLRRILGIQVSLVIIEGSDDTFTNVLSATSSDSSVVAGHTPPPAAVPAAAVAVSSMSASPDYSVSPVNGTVSPSQSATYPDSDSDGEGAADPNGNSRSKVDYPERYAELKHRTKLVLTSYTNMVGSIAPEVISYNSTIVKEVVRLSATEKGARSLNLTLANQFGLIFLDFPGFARIGKELADRGVFNRTNRIIHRLLAHAQIERYLEVIYSILAQTPSVLLLRDRADGFLPCDRIKSLPDTKTFKYALLASFINAIPTINAERAAAVAAAKAGSPAAEAKAGAAVEGSSEGGRDSPAVKVEEDKLTGDEAFMSIYGGEEELIVRALHFANMETTPAEVRDKKFDLQKTDAATGENIFHKCIACYIDEPYIYNSAIETFKIALRVLRERHVAGELTQLAAEKLLFSARTLAGETAWTLAYKHDCRPMVEAMVADWTKTGAASGAPAEALAMAPASRAAKKTAHSSADSAAPAAPAATSSRDSGRLGGSVKQTSLKEYFEMEGKGEQSDEEKSTTA